LRAWDKKNKVMCYVWCIAWKAWDRDDEINYVEVESMKKPDGTYELFEHEVDLLQRTPIKEKDGVDIYDGHVVKFVSSEGEQGPFVKPVHFDEKLAQWCFGEMSYCRIKESAYFQDLHVNLEIVGNIYETPELLK